MRCMRRLPSPATGGGRLPAPPYFRSRIRDRKRNDPLRRAARICSGSAPRLNVVAPLRCASIFAMPTQFRHGRSSCPVARSLDVLGYKWTLLITREALNGTTRFSAFWRQIPGWRKDPFGALAPVGRAGRVRHHFDQRNLPVPRIRPHRDGTPHFSS